MITKKSEALDELYYLIEFFDEHVIRMGVGPRNADRQKERIQEIMNYLKTVRTVK